MRFSNGFRALAAVIVLTVPTAALNYNVSLNSQVHLAYSGSTGMTVSWNTYSQLSKPTVMYGFSPDAMIFSSSSDVSVTYNTSLTYNNHVKISNLLPNTQYYYMPSDLLNDSFTRPPYSFKTGRVAGDMTPHSVALVIDMGTFGAEGLYTSAGTGVASSNILQPGEQTTIQSLIADLANFEFLMHPGDIAYADTWLKEALTGFINVSIADGYKAYESILDGFYNEMTPITSLKPYMVGPGNHEANCDNGGTKGYTTSICMPGQSNFTGYINHFRMPSDVSNGLGNFWYSYDYGMVHYIYLDTETDLGNGLVGPSEPISGPFGALNQQITWLEADLQAVDRSKTPWIVVAGHRPWYSSGSICKNCQTAFEPLLLKYGVDLYVAGHFHVVERMAPIANGVIDKNELNNPSAPWYIVDGAAGHYDGLDSFTYPLQPYHRFGLETANGTYGWSKLTYHNCTHMTHEFISSNNGSVLDSATLYKNRTCGVTIPSTSTSSSSSSSTLISTVTSILTSTSTSIVSGLPSSSTISTSVPLGNSSSTVTSASASSSVCTIITPSGATTSSSAVSGLTSSSTFSTIVPSGNFSATASSTTSSKSVCTVITPGATTSSAMSGLTSSSTFSTIVPSGNFSTTASSPTSSKSVCTVITSGATTSTGVSGTGSLAPTASTAVSSINTSSTTSSKSVCTVITPGATTSTGISGTGSLASTASIAVSSISSSSTTSSKSVCTVITPGATTSTGVSGTGSLASTASTAVTSNASVVTSSNNLSGTGTSVSTTSTALTSNASAASSPSLTTSVVYTTVVSTITACPSTVTNCPLSSTTVITTSTPLYTTVITVTPVETASSSIIGAGSGGSGNSGGNGGNGGSGSSGTQPYIPFTPSASTPVTGAASNSQAAALSGSQVIPPVNPAASTSTLPSSNPTSPVGSNGVSSSAPAKTSGPPLSNDAAGKFGGSNFALVAILAALMI